MKGKILLEESIITMTIKYYSNNKDIPANHRERIIKVNGNIIYTDYMPFTSNMDKFDSIIDSFNEWCIKSNKSLK